MIVKMKRITVLGLASREKESLNMLRDMGIVHVTHVQKPQSERIDLFSSHIDTMRRALSVLEARNVKIVREPCDSVLDMAKHVLALMDRKNLMKERLLETKKTMKFLKPLGDFSPADIQFIKENGLDVKIYRCSKKDLMSLPEDVSYEVVYEKGSQVMILAVSKKELALPLDEFAIPKKGISDLEKDKERLEKLIDSMDKELDAQAAFANCMRDKLEMIKENLAFNEVRSGMGQDEALSYLQGYCPADRVDKIKSLTGKMGWALLVEDPAEDVPTLIRNPKWLNMTKPLFDFMSTVPGYKEYDISLWFLVFLSIFFAMLVGDGGYGLIFLTAVILLKLKFKKAPVEPFLLFGVFSTATIIWGAITGNWFGVQKIAQLPFLKGFVIPSIDTFADSADFMMHLCFIIAIIHLTLAHVLQAIRMINSLKALAQLGWILIMWGLYFIAGKLVLGRDIPSFTPYFLYSGFFLVAAFSKSHKNPIIAFLMGVADLPMNIISAFSDVVSYIRLFAVGLASFILAKTFNEMAADIGWNSLFMGIVASLILLLGHALNIILALMAVLVHGIRLNMLEFTNHMSMTWSGVKFNPFKSKTKFGSK